MSEIIYDWLNNEVKLSTKVDKIEKDFSTGYLFAELLVKYKQIPSIDKFYNSNLHKHKVHNFTILDKTFKDFRIRLSPEEYKLLIEGKKNLAKQILYRIKMQLSKKEINFDNIMLKNSNTLHDLYKKMNYPKVSQKAEVENLHRGRESKSKEKNKSTAQSQLSDPDGYFAKIIALKKDIKYAAEKGSMTELPKITSHRSKFNRVF